MYNGQQYYANLLLPPAGSNTGKIYFAQVADACTDGDQAISLTLRDGGFADYNNIITAACQTKNIVDATITVTGCLSVIGATFCAFAVVPTDGAALWVCDAVWDYAGDKGAADCLQGVSGAIADALGHSDTWTAFSATYDLSEGQYADVLGTLLDVFCDKAVNPVLQ